MGGGGGGGEFPPLLINSVKRTKKGEGKRERKGGEGKHKRKRKKGEEKGKGKFFRCSDDRRIKVGPHNESYVWVPKSESFVKLQEVGKFRTRVTSSLKAV